MLSGCVGKCLSGDEKARPWRSVTGAALMGQPSDSGQETPSRKKQYKKQRTKTTCNDHLRVFKHLTFRLRVVRLALVGQAQALHKSRCG